MQTLIQLFDQFGNLFDLNIEICIDWLYSTLLNQRFRRLLFAFHLLLIIRLASIPYFQLIIRHRVVEDLLYLGHLVLRNIQLWNILRLLLSLFKTLLASLKVLIVGNDITLQHCDVFLHNPNCSLFDTNVFLSL